MLLVNPENGSIVDANRAASLFYGYNGEELKRLTVDDLNPLPKETLANFRRQVVQGKANIFEFQHRIASGELRDVEVHSSPIEFDGKVALFSIIHDIT